MYFNRSWDLTAGGRLRALMSDVCDEGLVSTMKESEHRSKSVDSRWRWRGTRTRCLLYFVVIHRITILPSFLGNVYLASPINGNL